jgi:hypothetical protein
MRLELFHEKQIETIPGLSPFGKMVNTGKGWAAYSHNIEAREGNVRRRIQEVEK